MNVVTMRVSFLIAYASTRLARFRRDTRGVSALEFALLLPLMFTLYSGCVDLAEGVSIDRRVTIAARTAADLVAQVANTTAADVDSVLTASDSIIGPSPKAANANVIVSLVKIDTKGVAKVVWSRAKVTKDARKKDEVVTVDAALKTPNTETYLVWGEARYTYTPLIGFIVLGPWPLNDQIFMRPRISASVDCSNCT